MMTSLRFVALTLIVAVLLPISPAIQAMTAEPAGTLSATAFPILLQVDAASRDEIVADFGTASPPVPFMLGRSKVKGGCLYLDWWYDTPGLWVSRCPDLLTAI